jgi:putative membrane protein
MMGYGWGWLIMIGLFALIILGIIVLVRYLRKTSRPKKQTIKTALDILNERYAKGEISEDEYRAKKSAING